VIVVKHDLIATSYIHFIHVEQEIIIL